VSHELAPLPRTGGAQELVLSLRSDRKLGNTQAASLLGGRWWRTFESALRACIDVFSAFTGTTENPYRSGLKQRRQRSRSSTHWTLEGTKGKES